jgi:hypothetical protein
VAALAWPAAMVAVLLVFRAPLTNLLQRLEKVEYQGLVVQLTKQATKAMAKLGHMAEEGIVDGRGPGRVRPTWPGHWRKSDRRNTELLELAGVTVTLLRI